jgi:hypothetical protein
MSSFILVFLKVKKHAVGTRVNPCFPFFWKVVNVVRQRRAWFFFSGPKSNDDVKLCFLVYLSVLRPVWHELFVYQYLFWQKWVYIRRCIKGKRYVTFSTLCPTLFFCHTNMFCAFDISYSTFVYIHVTFTDNWCLQLFIDWKFIHQDMLVSIFTM